MRIFAAHARMLAVAGVVVTLLFSTVGVADAQQDQRPAPVVETLRLACAPDLIDGQRGVLCQWSEATNVRTRGYKLLRITDGAPRELVATVGVNGRLGFFDTDVSAPSSLVYGVISVNRAGRLLGRSAPVTVQYGHDVGQLRLACAPDFVADDRGVLCRWSEATEPGTRGYLVYRVIDTDRRQVVARIAADGRNGYFDTNVVPGALHTYGVTAVDAAGNTLAIGGPEQVRWPVGSD